MRPMIPVGHPNHMAPSGPSAIPCGWQSVDDRSNSVTACVCGFIRTIFLLPGIVNQTLPLGPVAIPRIVWSAPVTAGVMAVMSPTAPKAVDAAAAETAAASARVRSRVMPAA